MTAINSKIEEKIDEIVEDCPDKSKYKINELSDGNIGAITVLANVIEQENLEKFNQVAKTLREEDITGSKIWIKFKDENNKDMSNFIQDVLN